MTMPAATQMREHETALRKGRMLIGGKWVESASGDRLEVEDPAHRRPIAVVPRAPWTRWSRAGVWPLPSPQNVRLGSAHRISKQH